MFRCFNMRTSKTSVYPRRPIEEKPHPVVESNENNIEDGVKMLTDEDPPIESVAPQMEPTVSLSSLVPTFIQSITLK